MTGDISTQLIKREELERTIRDLLTKEKALVEAGRRVLPSLEEGPIATSLNKDLVRREAYIEALEKGFVPVDARGFVRTDTKDKWNKSAVKASLRTMPEEARQAWEEAEKLGVFSSFSITTGERGDPVLVGNAGGKPFLIAVWVCVVGGGSVGFRFSSKKVEGA